MRNQYNKHLSGHATLSSLELQHLRGLPEGLTCNACDQNLEHRYLDPDSYPRNNDASSLPFANALRVMTHPPWAT